MPKTSRKKDTANLSSLLKEGYDQLDNVRADCPFCGEEIFASFMEVSAEGEKVFYLSCGAVDEEGDACVFFATLSCKDGKWQLLSCGYEEENENDGESCLIDIDEKNIE